MSNFKKSLLCDFSFQKKTFTNLDSFIKNFQKENFKKKNQLEKKHFICQTLLEMIQKEKEPCFLLPSIIDYFEKINENDILVNFNLFTFEYWLNESSNLSYDENYKVRAKMVGKFIPRDEYQAFFPIGMGKEYFGPHFVTAHISPDLDSTIASFWGWMDAFAARVSKSLHFWNVPAGPPESQIEIDLIFKNIFGKNIFSYLLKKRVALTLSGFDLMSQVDLIKKDILDSTTSLEKERNKNFIIIVDKNGYYLGDWKSADVEGIRQIIVLLNNCIRWFENTLQLKLISLFSKQHLKMENVSKYVNDLIKLKIVNCQPVEEYSENQKKYLDDYLLKVLEIKKGIQSTFEEFIKELKNKKIIDFDITDDLLSFIKKENLFQKDGSLIENRPKIFHFLENLTIILQNSINKIRNLFEQIENVLKIKHLVFKQQPIYVTVNADVDEIRKKIGPHQFLTVNYPFDKKLIPLGIIKAKDLKEKFLGTVSLRDFCNPYEMKIAKYLNVISVIDHHRSDLKTYSPPTAIIGDAQSSNTLVAIETSKINDSYSTFGLTLIEIDRQINNETNLRISQNLLRKKEILEKNEKYFVHREREFLEYLHFLYAIFDDTDLFMKISKKDVIIAAKIINKMKSIMMKKEMEIISLDDIKEDDNFAKNAARRILQNEDTFSLYNKVYTSREKEVDKNIEKCVKDEKSTIFADTKKLNGIASIGQTKLFLSNIKCFENNATNLRKKWFLHSKIVNEEQIEIDLFLHMISTIRSSKEVFESNYETYLHKDEMWIWIPSNDTSIEHLKSFLFSFRSCLNLKNNDIEVEFLGKNGNLYAQIFSENFFDIPQTFNEKENLPIAVLKYNASSINSRKAMVTPFLPKLFM